MSSHFGVYAAAALYDLAFGYRDFSAETQFVLEVYRRRRGRSARSFFELAAGPGRHALAAAAAGLSVTALDLSPQMAAYARDKAEHAGVRLSYLVADMVRFDPPGRFDLAACLLCSASYLLSDEVVLSHLSNVRGALEPDGMYLLELTHPAELSGAPKSKSSWRMRDDLGELEIDWGGDPAKAVGGIWESHVMLTYRPFDASPALCMQDDARQRGFTYQEVAGLAERAGFEVEASFGGFDADVPLDDPRANRMLVALKRS